MARYVIQNEVSTGIKKSLKKWGEIPINTEHLNGVIKINNYRKYTFSEEVDITFEGKISVRVGVENRTWYTTSILKKYSKRFTQNSWVGCVNKSNWLGFI